MHSFSKITRLVMIVMAALILSAGLASAVMLPVAPRIVTAGSASGTQGGTDVAIPISINDATGVGGIAFTIGYDPAVLLFKGLEQATSGWTVNNPDQVAPAGFKVPATSVVNGVAYYNPYSKTDPYATATYNTTPASTLFYQFNDVKNAGNQAAGRVLVSGASAVPLTGTVLFNAKFAIIGGINGTGTVIKLFQSVINNPAAGYTVDTFLPILVGTGDLDPATQKYTTLNFPEIAALLVPGAISITAPTYDLGGTVTYGGTALAAPDSIVILQRETAAG
jgi:hypothetical protein